VSLWRDHVSSLDEFRVRVEKQVRMQRYPVAFVSRGKRIAFFRAPGSGTLLVRVRPAKVNRLAEALAREVVDRRVCRYCGTEFTRRGRAIFCSPAHATRHRHERRLRRQQDQRKAASVTAQRNWIARRDAERLAHALAERRARRAAARRRQRASRKMAEAGNP
jgi:hypothetical protein